MTKFTPLLIAVSLALSSATAFAADGDVTLLVDRGSVMTSQSGGEFATAQSGQLLATGNRLMVTEGSAATVVYSDNCRRQYATPGVYVIEDDCRVAAGAARNGANGGTVAGVDWPAVGMVAAGVAIGAAALSQMDDVAYVAPPPVVPPAPLPISR